MIDDKSIAYQKAKRDWERIDAILFSDIPSNAKLRILAHLRLQQRTGLCRASNAMLAHAVGSERSASRATAWLRDHGYFESLTSTRQTNVSRLSEEALTNAIRKHRMNMAQHSIEPRQIGDSPRQIGDAGRQIGDGYCSPDWRGFPCIP